MSDEKNGEWEPEGTYPINETVVEVLTSDGDVKKGLYTDNWYRTCWKIQDSDGVFWRSFTVTVVRWRYIK